LNCTRRSRAMVGFSDTIQDLELIDPPLQGAQFTWSRGEVSFQASRIDRFLISPEWSEMFNAIKQFPLPRVFSDHKPIVLESGDWDASPSYFKFENMWLQSDGFLDMVRDWWNSYIVMGTPDFVLIQKLRHLKKDITKWNKEVFGKLDTQRHKSLMELGKLDQIVEQRPYTTKENLKLLDLKIEIQQIAIAEEIS